MDNQDQGNQNGGVLSKFWERIFNIKRSKSKKKGANQEFIQDKVNEIRDTIRRDNTPRYVETRSRRIVGIESEKKEKQELKNDSISQVIVKIRETSNERNYRRNPVGISNDRQDNVVGKEDLDKGAYSVQKESIPNKDNTLGDSTKNQVVSSEKSKKVRYGYISTVDKGKIKVGTDSEKKEFIKKLGAEIIDKLKESFEDKLDEISVLESELFLLEKSQENELELSKVREIKKKISELVKQVNELIDQYDLYRTSYYIDNITDIDDNILADDIIQYRELLDSFSSEKEFVKEYKALEEFQKFYRNLKAVRDDTERLVDNNEHKIEEFDIRDKKYNEIKLSLVSADEIDKNCLYEIEKQNEKFNNLIRNMDGIKEEEYFTTHLRGVGDLISNSLGYIGLLMLSPLSGLIPSIAVQARATRRMISNVYHNLHVESVRHVRYTAVDYSREYNQSLCDIDYVDDLLYDTLKDVKKLKEAFLLQYDSKIPGYEDTLKKIDIIERRVIHNQNRVNITRKKLEKGKKLNNDRLVRVKQMNDRAA